MTTNQPPHSFFFGKLLLVRKWPPISLHIHSSTKGRCWSEKDHISASIFIHLLKANVGQKKTIYQPQYSFFYWRLLLVRKWPSIMRHIHSSTERCCWSENDHLSASIFIHLLKGVVGQKMTTYQPPYSFFYWRLLLLRKWPPISLHIHSSTKGGCCTKNDHLSASIYNHLLKAVVAQKMTTYQPPYSFFYWRICSSENDHLSASIYNHLLKAVVAQKMTTYQPPYKFFSWRLKLVRKWPRQASYAFF